MNLTKTMTVAALIAAASTGLTHAAVINTYITGSTAFRSAAENAIAHILTKPLATYATKSGTPASIASADYVTFTGTNAGNSYAVYVSWSGSEAGIAAVAQTSGTLPLTTFLAINASNPMSTVTPGTAPSSLTGGTQTTSPVFEQDVAAITMADTWQATTPFHGTLSGTTYGTLTGTTVMTGVPPNVVGVVPFKFVGSLTDKAGTNFAPKSASETLQTTMGSYTATLDAADTTLKAGSYLSGNSALAVSTSIVSITPDGLTITLSTPAKVTADNLTTISYMGLSNMTTNLAKKTFTGAGGTLASLAQYTGSVTDATVMVIPVGRNHDSGTRASFVLNTGIDAPSTFTTAIQQYYPYDIDGTIVGTSTNPDNTTIESYALVPAETINGHAYTIGQSGYSSGGNLAKVFKATNDVDNTVYVSYLGLNDANTALGGNAQEMSYDGVYYSPTAVDQGQYTFWDYEHLYYLTNYTHTSFPNQMAVELAKVDITISGVSMTDGNFKASRVPNTADGVVVTR